jgi:Amt family ammonium transporter
MSPISSGDTAWVLASAALVMVMTPALGFFYDGMVRRKNVLGTVMHSFIIIALISVQWVLWGYTLAFGPDRGGIIGGLDWLGANGVGLTPNANYAATIPDQAYMIFQAMFAIITPAPITGTFAERMKFRTFLVFILLWATLVYDPIAHWVWGGLHRLGALDFAGGTVVHISSGSPPWRLPWSWVGVWDTGGSPWSPITSPSWSCELLFSGLTGLGSTPAAPCPREA